RPGEMPWHMMVAAGRQPEAPCMRFAGSESHGAERNRHGEADHHAEFPPDRHAALLVQVSFGTRSVARRPENVRKWLVSSRLRPVTSSKGAHTEPLAGPRGSPRGRHKTGRDKGPIRRAGLGVRRHETAHPDRGPRCGPAGKAGAASDGG